MIRLSDITLIESGGSFSNTKRIMEEDGVTKWMLKSNVTVSTDVITCNYVIHFWNDANVYIIATDHPAVLNVPDDDIREISQWAVDNGWNVPIVDDKLVEDQRQFEFWLRMYRTGLVKCGLLKKYDDNEIQRLSDLSSNTPEKEEQ